MSVPCTSTVVGVAAGQRRQLPGQEVLDGGGGAAGGLGRGGDEGAERRRRQLTAPRLDGTTGSWHSSAYRGPRGQALCALSQRGESGRGLLGGSGNAVTGRRLGQEQGMRTRTLGSLTVPAQGLGCMGMSEFYGTGDQAGGRADHPPRPRPRRHLPRHRRHVRPVHQRAARRPGDRRPPRRGRAGHQVRQRARRGRLLPRHQRPPGVRPPRLRRLAAAARRRRHRPLLPAPGGHDGAGRGHLGRAARSSSTPARSGTPASPRPPRRPSAGRTRCSR